jgi:flagellar L-ring protein precursor FlgH
VKLRVNHRRWAVTSLLLVASFAPATTRGESLWERRDPTRAFMFYDTGARRVGDVVTVLIDDVTNVANSDDRSMNKETNASKSMDVASEATGDFGGPVGAAAFDFNSDSERSFDGDATFSSQREFSTRVTASVIDVLPNGNLVIEGSRNVGIAGDERVLIVSGIVRPYDISPGNTVLSRHIAKLRIAYDGNGQEQAFTRQGMFGRIMNKLWPW